MVGLVLLAALLHATWNAFVKGGRDPLLVLASMNAVGLIAGAVFIPFVAAPHPASWFYLCLSVVLHVGYYAFLLLAYRVGDLSHIYPLARGSAPLLIAMGAFMFAGELLSPLALAGVVLASAGIVSLAFEHGPPWRGDARPLLYALATGLFIASYSVTDGLGVRLSESPLGYIAWLFFLDGWPPLLFALWRRYGRIRRYLRAEWRTCIGSGVASMLAYGLVIYAMSLGAMALVSAVRETSVIFAALIGMFILRERFSWPRISAAVVVALGVVVMSAGK